MKHPCKIILHIEQYALRATLLPVADSVYRRLTWLTVFNSLFSKVAYSVKRLAFSVYCLRFAVFPLLTAYCLLPAVLNAQAGWGPDVRLTYRQGYSYDPKAACCGDTIHMVWWEGYVDSGIHEEVFYKRSIDAGETWGDDVRLSEEDDNSSLVPTVGVNGDYIHVVWREYGLYYYAICYRKSTDGGNTWGTIDTLYETSMVGIRGTPRLGVCGDTLYLVTTRDDGNALFNRSTDNGVNWDTAIVIGEGAAHPSFKIGKSNGLYLALSVDGSGVVEIFFYKSNNGGVVWADSQVISDNDGVGSQCPAMDTDDSAGIHITWYDYKYSPYPWTGDIFYRASRDTGSTWEPIDSLTTQHRARHSDILSERNNLHLVWDDDRNGFGENEEIYYRMSTDLGQSWGNEVRLTDALCHSRDPALACADQYLHLFWSDMRDDSNNMVDEIYYKRKDLSQGVVELESLVPTLHLWFELYPTLFSKTITIRYGAWGKEQQGLNQVQDNPAMPYALCAKVYDIIGKEVMKKEETVKGENGAAVQIDTEDLPCGVYFVELQADNVREVHKVVKIK